MRPSHLPFVNSTIGGIFTPSQRYTVSVGGIDAVAYNVSLSSNRVSNSSSDSYHQLGVQGTGMETCFDSKNLTVSRVFCISGIELRSRCNCFNRLTSMNLYFLASQTVHHKKRDDSISSNLWRVALMSSGPLMNSSTWSTNGALGIPRGLVYLSVSFASYRERIRDFFSFGLCHGRQPSTNKKRC